MPLPRFHPVVHELWWKERQRYPWIADFLCVVDLDCFEHKGPAPTESYAATYGVSRRVIRRFLEERKAILERANEGPETGQPRANVTFTNQLVEPITGQRRANDGPTTGPTLLRETETETKTKTEEREARTPRTRCPEAFTTEEINLVASWGAEHQPAIGLEAVERGAMRFVAHHRPKGKLGTAGQWIGWLKLWCSRDAVEYASKGNRRSALSAAQARSQRNIEAARQVLAERHGHRTPLLLEGDN